MAVSITGKGVEGERNEKQKSSLFFCSCFMVLVYTLTKNVRELGENTWWDLMVMLRCVFGIW